MRWSRTFGVGLGLGVLGRELSAQSAPAADVSATAEFSKAVRRATARYQEQAAAITDGYRRIGPDFPSMGEHWISIPLIVSGTVDPDHPPILEYATLEGRPTLVGVAYTQLLRSGLPAAPLPALPADWHYHAGTVDEESFILGHAGHAGRAHAGAGAEGPRIAVLHAWVWVDNPAGLFATDNWALAYLRLGLPVPPRVGPVPATLALALAAGGESYFQTLLELRYHPEPEEVRAVRELLADQAAAIREEVAPGRAPAPEALTRRWLDLEGAIRAGCRSCDVAGHPLFGAFPEPHSGH